MALAKYLEDIDESRMTNTAGYYESRISGLKKYFVPPKKMPGEVRVLRSGRPMEDVEVCVHKDFLKFQLEYRGGIADPNVEIDSGGVSKRIIPNENREFELTLEKEGLHKLRVSSGGYVKLYSIHLIEPLVVEALPGFLELIRNLTDNPPTWDAKTFGDFHVQLKSVLEKENVPQLFINGIVEYHLGLYLEEQRKEEFRERFQAAYGNLRWFIPYSDISRLICAYYLYCANQFESALDLCGEGDSRLKSILSLLVGESSGDDISTPERGVIKAFPLLISKEDLLSFQIVEALEDGRHAHAAELFGALSTQVVSKFHKERAERLKFLKACISLAEGNTEKAKRSFEGLKHSAWPSIEKGARLKLDRLNDD